MRNFIRLITLTTLAAALSACGSEHVNNTYAPASFTKTQKLSGFCDYLTFANISTAAGRHSTAVASVPVIALDVTSTVTEGVSTTFTGTGTIYTGYVADSSSVTLGLKPLSTSLGPINGVPARLTGNVSGSIIGSVATMSFIPTAGSYYSRNQLVDGAATGSLTLNGTVDSAAAGGTSTAATAMNFGTISGNVNGLDVTGTMYIADVSTFSLPSAYTGQLAVVGLHATDSYTASLQTGYYKTSAGGDYQAVGTLTVNDNTSGTYGNINFKTSNASITPTCGDPNGVGLIITNGYQTFLNGDWHKDALQSGSMTLTAAGKVVKITLCGMPVNPATNIPTPTTITFTAN